MKPRRKPRNTNVRLSEKTPRLVVRITRFSEDLIGILAFGLLTSSVLGFLGYTIGIKAGEIASWISGIRASDGQIVLVLMSGLIVAVGTLGWSRAKNPLHRFITRLVVGSKQPVAEGNPANPRKRQP